MPRGLVTWYDSEDCSNGWSELPSALGRLVVSVVDAEAVGVTVNQALGDREDRTHIHSYSTQATFPQKDVAAIGCCNNQGAQHGAYNILNNVSAQTSSYPFTQLKLCRLDQDNTDPVAFGTVAYFDPDFGQCPDGWQAFSESKGRILVPAYKDGGAVTSSATPLQSGEDRHHNHDFSTSFTATSVSYAGVEGCCNSGPSAAGTIDVAGTTSSESNGLPYVQLLTCISVVDTFNSSFPSGALAFNAVQCPPGWNVSIDVAGRFLVAANDGALVGASFGGSSLAADGSSNPTHTHAFSGEVATNSAGVGLASGCCGSGYAANGVYSYDGVSQATELDLPYLMLALCGRFSQ